MNTWQVVSERFPYLTIALTVQDRNSSLEALIDTGYDGDMVVPEGLIDHSVLVDGSIVLILADGSERETPAYLAEATIGPIRMSNVVLTVLGTAALVGRGLIQRFRVTLDHGERVIVEP